MAIDLTKIPPTQLAEAMATAIASKVPPPAPLPPPTSSLTPTDEHNVEFGLGQNLIGECGHDVETRARTFIYTTEARAAELRSMNCGMRSDAPEFAEWWQYVARTLVADLPSSAPPVELPGLAAARAALDAKTRTRRPSDPVLPTVTQG